MKQKFLNLIGKQVIDSRNKRVGYIKKIAFKNKNYSIVWFLFAHDKGEYILPLEEIKTTQLNLFN